MSEQGKVRDIIMVGAGPSALSAAIYTTREELDTVMVEKGVIGGLAAITDQVDNYPGFKDGVTGLELAQQMQAQAERFGAEIAFGEVSGITRGDDGIITVATSEGDMKANAVLIATGSDYRKLGIPGEEEFYGRGVHFCATCDGAFYKDKRIVVIGGGNSAAQEALFLTRFSSDITVLIRGEAWKASDVLVKEIENNDKIKVEFNVSSTEIVGADNLVTGVKATHKTEGEKVYETDGVFVFIGLIPNTKFLKDTGVELDEYGFVKTNSELMTAVEGVFCSGDVRSGATMQIASATGEGATAALMMRKYLEEKELGS